MVIHRFQNFLGMMFSASGASFVSVKGYNEEKTAPSLGKKDLRITFSRPDPNG
jgi:hypothetical protein